MSIARAESWTCPKLRVDDVADDAAIFDIGVRVSDLDVARQHARVWALWSSFNY